ncbi:carbohydrate ABC transporter membrane protein 2 (CUT1 family) [Melghiribacillus thermohalophilus]|uniref:Carbohydrate ABC transporter membrane protein 2 (CUT1 family) n=2 Tax=Melghiribacillus thermohalophilus TaxID=1324956 RepID=A0A4R3N0F1_9BACI|nr:carbohydrate ABC transporter permease [Melghiribacillus thermohalophilus]TCT20493.1 carbohydrate ABC transporter membrane protein 2 (CUT1 family) [Melghiribacillus thermohalophilus]
MYRMKKRISTGFVHVLLLSGALLSLFPFYWMFVMATNHNSAINQVPPAFLPGNQTVENFKKVLSNVDFFGSMWNSFVVSTLTTLGVLFLCSLAGFAFAKYKFPGKNILFLFILLTMMVPPQLGLIPQYYIITKLDWLNDLKAVIVPGLIDAFGIFWMRQYISSAIPDELMDAAKIDGCSNFRIYWNIAVPMILPAFSTLAIIKFMYMWNDFLWPLVVLREESVYTIQIAIRSLMDNYVRDYGMILSGTFWATLPLVFIFLFFNKLFIDSLTQGALKS